MIFIRIFLLFCFFLKKMIIANLDIAKFVLWKPERIQPALIKVPLDIKTDRGIFLLSSMVTLTPGTLSLDVSEDRRYLYVHVTNTEEPLNVIASIKQDFEKRLMEVGC